MSANVETMFYTRETPWHGLGTKVEEAPGSREALELAGLNWKVFQKPVMTQDGQKIPGYKANIRDLDRKVLGIVTDRYRVVQNEEAFASSTPSTWNRMGIKPPSPASISAVHKPFSPFSRSWRSR